MCLDKTIIFMLLFWLVVLAGLACAALAALAFAVRHLVRRAERRRTFASGDDAGANAG